MDGNWLKHRREELGLSQEDLARQLQLSGIDVTRAAISHWETDRNNSPLQAAPTIRVLAEILQVDVEEMLGAETEQSPAAKRAASIVDNLPPEWQDIAIAQLQVLQRAFSKEM